MINMPCNPTPNDITELKRMWSTIFGNIGLETFFSKLFHTEHCVIVRSDNNIAAMGYLLPAGNIIADSNEVPCAMIYSIATLPQYRGLGLGSTVVNALTNAAYDLGYPVTVLHPSEDSLFEYYSRHAKFKDYFYANELTYKNMSDIAKHRSDLKPEEVSITEYIYLRKELLGNKIHISSDPHLLEYQQKLCDELGGGLFRIGDSCATVECQPDGSVYVKELLSADCDVTQVLASLTSRFPSSKHVVRTPARTEGLFVGNRRFGMLTSSDMSAMGAENNDHTPWYGLAFD